MPSNVTPYNIPVPGELDPVDVPADLNAMATAVGTALDGKQPYEYYRPSYVSGYYYSTWCGISNVASTQDRMITMPFWVHTTNTFDRIGLYVTGAVGGSTIRLGIYSDLGTEPKPDALLLDAGTIDSSSTGAKEITISEALPQGLYWMAAVAQGGQPSFHMLGNNVMGIPGLAGLATDSIYTNTANSSNWLRAGVSGALPDPSGVTSISNNAPRIFLRSA
jgi:hypothetical protein